MRFFAAALLLGLLLASACAPRPPEPAERLSTRAGPLGRATPSLSAVSGLWETPTAQVLSDWTVRPGFAWNQPYRAYNASLGLLDRLEVFGQFTEVTSREGFPDEDGDGGAFGSFKDRSFGLKAVLLTEKGLRPQLAVGFTDLAGTALFASRYVVLGSGLETPLGPARLSFGLGQGVLGGESLFADPVEGDRQTENAGDFHLSSPWRRTRPFGGLRLALTDRLQWATEYSPLNHDDLFGFDDPSGWPINVGLKYRVLENTWLQAALLRGDTPALGVASDLTLSPQGLFSWRAEPEVEVRERQRWKAALAKPSERAQFLVKELADEGFKDAQVRIKPGAIWAEGRDVKHLSVLRGLGRMAKRILAVVPAKADPERILYLNLTRGGRIIHSLRASAGLLQSYLDSRLDQAAFLEFASLSEDGRRHLADFKAIRGHSHSALAGADVFDLTIEPKVRTFINNREGFFKHRAFVRGAARVRPWAGGYISVESEVPLYNNFDEVAFQPLEPDPVRTDLVAFEQLRGVRLTELAFDQLFPLEYGFWGRSSVGYFESAFFGFGTELFRLWLDGRLGLGLQSELVFKRSLESNFALDADSDAFQTLFLNLYAQLWPSEGISLALKGGRFLAGDPGARIELRRTKAHYTIGAWVTVTDTSRFSSPENREATDKGVFISIPLSIFTDHEVGGRFNYTLRSFLRDQGQLVRQPRTLFPSHPDDTVARTKRDMEELRR